MRKGKPATEPLYLDITLAPGARWRYTLPDGHNAFAYAFEGDARVGELLKVVFVPNYSVSLYFAEVWVLRPDRY